ncbi:MAG: hypothetical protein GY737_25420 [Desulfobacteraceae bacterium]|nr:hypothetical protein [Desulfobacteraceae bacterium]
MTTSTSPNQLINQFAHRNDKAAFPKFHRNVVENQLRDRLAHPWKINQGMTSLCGPAAFLYCIAVKNPGKYVKYIIDLYEKGEAAIDALSIKPGRDCKNI